MNQLHPTTLEMLAKAHRADLVAEARNNRLVRESRQIGSAGADHQQPILSLIRASRMRLAGVALASALALGAVAGAAIASSDTSGQAAAPAPAAPAAGAQQGGGRALHR